MKYPTHAIRIKDSWDGEGDIITLLAFKKDGVFYAWDSLEPALQHEGDEILYAWELDTQKAK